MTLTPSDEDEGQRAKDLHDWFNMFLLKSGTSLNVSYGSSWGRTVEKSDLFVLVVGWKSLEVREFSDFRGR